MGKKTVTIIVGGPFSYEVDIPRDEAERCDKCDGEGELEVGSPFSYTVTCSECGGTGWVRAED